jgi:hypothetical protein
VRALLFDSLPVALSFVGLDFRRDRGAGEPRRVGGAGPDEVALHLRRGRPVRQRRRHHRRHGAGVVGDLLQAQEDPGTTAEQLTGLATNDLTTCRNSSHLNSLSRSFVLAALLLGPSSKGERSAPLDSATTSSTPPGASLSRLILPSVLQAVHFEECRGVSVQGVTLQNGQQFHLTFTRCSDVKANFLRVIAPADSPNTDGIHLNDSSHVRIMDNLISTGSYVRMHPPSSRLLEN